ncbi:MAG: hypothetical protein ACK5K7_03700 [Bacilli bacterium]
MKKFSGQVIAVILTTVVMFVSLLFYETYFSNSKYNKNFGYIDNLSEINEVYAKLGDFHLDLENMGFLNVGENSYERSYNKFLCEKIIIENEEVYYYILDSCVSVYENTIKTDFDSDGYNMIYHVDNLGNFSYLRFAGEKDGGFQKYNLSNGDFEIQGRIINKHEIEKYNAAYVRFIKQINALIF